MTGRRWRGGCLQDWGFRLRHLPDLIHKPCDCFLALFCGHVAVFPKLFDHTADKADRKLIAFGFNFPVWDDFVNTAHDGAVIESPVSFKFQIFFKFG